MKNLFKNIWQAPASTVAAALVAAIGVATAADIELSKELIVGLSALSAFLAVFSGPNKPTPGSKLPVILLTGLWVGCAVCGLTSCGASFSVVTPLPGELGGGTATITVIPEK